MQESSHHITKQLKMAPGSEMRTAFKETNLLVKQNKLKIFLKFRVLDYLTYSFFEYVNLSFKCHVFKICIFQSTRMRLPPGRPTDRDDDEEDVQRAHVQRQACPHNEKLPGPVRHYHVCYLSFFQELRFLKSYIYKILNS